MVLSTSFFKAKHAFVITGVRRFIENESLLWPGNIEATVADLFVIFLEIELQQRKLKSTSTLKGTVTLAAIVAEPAHQRHDVLPEIRRFADTRRLATLIY